MPERGKKIKRLEKLLEDAGIKLSSVASDISGVSGRLMLDALIDAERNPHAPADRAKRRPCLSALLRCPLWLRAVPVQALRVNDKRVDEQTGERIRFSSAIPPAWARKSPQVA